MRWGWWKRAWTGFGSFFSDKHESPYEVSFSSYEELSFFFFKETSSHQNANVRSGTIRNIMLVQWTEGHWERVAIGEVPGQG